MQQLSNSKYQAFILKVNEISYLQHLTKSSL
jgi:hypothetical protein